MYPYSAKMTGRLSKLFKFPLRAAGTAARRPHEHAAARLKQQRPLAGVCV